MVWNVFYKLLTTSQNFIPLNLIINNMLINHQIFRAFNGEFIVLNRMVANSNPFFLLVYTTYFINVYVISNLPSNGGHSYCFTLYSQPSLYIISLMMCNYLKNLTKKLYVYFNAHCVILIISIYLFQQSYRITLK